VPGDVRIYDRQPARTSCPHLGVVSQFASHPPVQPLAAFFFFLCPPPFSGIRGSFSFSFHPQSAHVPLPTLIFFPVTPAFFRIRVAFSSCTLSSGGLFCLTPVLPSRPPFSAAMAGFCWLVLVPNPPPPIVDVPVMCDFFFLGRDLSPPPLRIQRSFFSVLVCKKPVFGGEVLFLSGVVLSVLWASPIQYVTRAGFPVSRKRPVHMLILPVSEDLFMPAPLFFTGSNWGHVFVPKCTCTGAVYTRSISCLP